MRLFWLRSSLVRLRRVDQDAGSVPLSWFVYINNDFSLVNDDHSPGSVPLRLFWYKPSMVKRVSDDHPVGSDPVSWF